MGSAQYSVHLTGGYAPRFQAFSLAQAHSVKKGYLVPPQAGNASRWAARETKRFFNNEAVRIRPQ